MGLHNGRIQIRESYEAFPAVSYTHLNAWYKGFENAMMPMDITAMTAMPMALLVLEVIVFLLIVSLLGI